MKHATLNDHTYALRLDKGDDIHACIQGFCSELQINNASLQGIGSVESPTLAHYSVNTKKYTDHDLSGIFEVTSLLGNVALVAGKPLAHLHVTLCDQQMQALGGHLVKGECSATLELIITSYPSKFTKTLDDAVGLKLWDF